MNDRVLVVGLDAADPQLADKWSTDLPNIASIMKSGVSGMLKSTVPPISVPAWPCFSTGKNPGKVGVFDFLNLGSDLRLSLADSRSSKSQTVWSILSRKNKFVVVLGVPGTYPPERVNGVLVCGFPASFSKDYTYPPELRSELDKVTGGYLVDVLAEPEAVNLKGGLDPFLKEVDRYHESNLTAAKHLMKKYPWDLFVVVFRALDIVQHRFWPMMDSGSDQHYADIIRKWYIRADRAVGELFELCDNNTYKIVMSDHGFASSKSHFFMNEFLKANGFLKLRSSAPRDFEGFTRWRDFFLQRLGPELIRFLLPFTPKRVLLRFSTRNAYRHAAARLLEAIDWSGTRAFALGHHTFRIYLNVKGRQPYGILAKSEYEAARMDLIDKLQTITGPKGERITTSIWSKEDLYSGDFLNEAPDLCVELFLNGTKVEAAEELRNGQLWSETAEAGGIHTINGIWAMKGPHTRNGVRFDADILDLAPTILYLMGCSIPSDMDGQPLATALTSEYVNSHPIAFNDEASVRPAGGREIAFSKEDEEEVKRRLASLGYI